MKKFFKNIKFFGLSFFFIAFIFANPKRSLAAICSWPEPTGITDYCTFRTSCFTDRYCNDTAHNCNETWTEAACYYNPNHNFCSSCSSGATCNGNICPINGNTPCYGVCNVPFPNYCACENAICCKKCETWQCGGGGSPTCGNGVIDTGEECEANSDCDSGETCNASCMCEGGEPEPGPTGAGLFGKIWYDKNKDGSFTHTDTYREEYQGDPLLVLGGFGVERCNEYTENHDFSVMVSNVNFAHEWHCAPNDVCNYWSDDITKTPTQPRLPKDNTYTATLTGIPEGKTCGPWRFDKCVETILPTCSSIKSGSGCAATLPIDSNLYYRLDWRLIDAPTSPPAEWVRIIGFMWSNEDGTDNWYVLSNRWRGSDSITCTANQPNLFTNFSILTDFDGNFTNNLIKYWACNGSVPNDHQWYATAGYNIRGDQVDIRLDSNNLPLGYSCDSWIARNSSNITIGSGVGCSVDNIVVPDSGDLRVFWKMKKTCTPGCDYGDWGGCTNGFQTRTATPRVCGGTCSEPTTRSCLYVEGHIWSDYNNNDSPDNAEKWKKETNVPPWCYTSLTYPSFLLTYTDHTSNNQISDWWCSTDDGVYYRGPRGVNANIEPEEPHTFTLSQSSLPQGKSCGTWEYTNSLNVSETSGLGCTASNLTMPAGSWINIHWCLVDNGNLSGWGDCQANGKQYRTCTGNTCCGSTCGNNCGGVPVVRDCLRVTGNIWSDDDRSGGQNVGESWKGDNALICTDKFWDRFTITESIASVGLPINLISNWWCHNGNNLSYYNSPDGEIEPEYKKVFALDNKSLPPYSKCGFWQYYNEENGAGNLIASGDGCTTSNLTMPSSGWVNVNFELCKGVWVDDPSGQCDTLCGPGKVIRKCGWSNPLCTGEAECDKSIPPTDCNQNPDDVCHYNILPVVREIPPEIIDLPAECPGSWSTYPVLGDMSVTVQSIVPVTGWSLTDVSDADGKVSFEVPYTYRQVAFTSNTNTGGVEPENYSLKCPGNPYPYPEPPFNYQPSDTIPWNGGLGTYPSYNIDLGVQADYKGGWVSAIDSDIFANLLEVVVPLGPTDNEDPPSQTPQGFAKTLINSSSNNNTSLGFAFSQTGGVENSPNTPEKIFESLTETDSGLGGNAYNLIGSSNDHRSKWLENFTFKAPSNSKKWELTNEGPLLVARFIPGEIYYVESGYFQSLLNFGSEYRLSSGVSVLYVIGDITIKKPIRTPDIGRLLLIVDGSVTISKDVGSELTTFPVPPAQFNMSQNPHIMAGIVASGDISFESVGELIVEGNRDKAIMVSAPLISKTSISLARDLYHRYNATIPAESAKAFNKYLYLLSSLEREKSVDYLYFTGLTTYDLDWEYIY